MRGRCKARSKGKPWGKYHADRGIKVCSEWDKSFASFAEWALANGYRDDLTIDRIDSAGDYEPDNCQWLPADTHGRKSALKLSPAKVAEIKALMVAGARNAEIAERYGVSLHTVYGISSGKTWTEVPFPDGRKKKGLHGIQRHSPWPARRAGSTGMR